jgi:hypothetical protein
MTLVVYPNKKTQKICRAWVTPKTVSNLAAIFKVNPHELFMPEQPLDVPTEEILFRYIRETKVSVNMALDEIMARYVGHIFQVGQSFFCIFPGNPGDRPVTNGGCKCFTINFPEKLDLVYRVEQGWFNVLNQ